MSRLKPLRPLTREGLDLLHLLHLLRRRRGEVEVPLGVGQCGHGRRVFLELERIIPPGAPGLAAQAELVGMVTGLGVDVERVEETYDSLLRAAVG